MRKENYQEHEEVDNKRQEEKVMVESINKLKQDVDYIKDEVEEMNVKELLKKLNHMVDNIEAHLNRLEREINNQKENYKELKEIMASERTKNSSPRLSEYKILQNMLKSSGAAEVTPTQKRNQLSNNRRPTPGQNIPRSSTFSNGQLSNSRDKSQKTHGNPQNLFNKNIITRKSK